MRIVKQKMPLFIKDKVAGEFFLQQLSLSLSHWNAILSNQLHPTIIFQSQRCAASNTFNFFRRNLKNSAKISGNVFSYTIGGLKPPKKRIASSVCTALGKQRHDRKFASVPRCEKTYCTGRKAIVGHSAGKGCLSGIAGGEKRTAITTDHAVERLLLFPRYFCIVIEWRLPKFQTDRGVLYGIFA